MACRDRPRTPSPGPRSTTTTAPARSEGAVEGTCVQAMEDPPYIDTSAPPSGKTLPSPRNPPKRFFGDFEARPGSETRHSAERAVEGYLVQDALEQPQLALVEP